MKKNLQNSKLLNLLTIAQSIVLKSSFKSFLLLSFASIFFVACSDPLEDEVAPEAQTTKSEPITTGVDYPSSTASTTPTGEVMMQAFYWDVPEGGTWWNVIDSKLASWQTAGITSLWLPVISKGQSGGYSMGYDPYDYYDFGQYDQMGSIETRFGSDTELKKMIANAKNRNMKLIADIVVNHNSGGDLEYNPFTNSDTYTKFNPKSGMFTRSYWDFHPNDIATSDEGAFGGYPDLCHKKDYVKDWLWLRTDGIANYYKNQLGFDGWRFDYVKGFGPWVVKDWNAAVGGISVGEYWDGNAQTLNWWCTEANSAAFDFALYYALDRGLDGRNMYELDGAGLAAINSSLAYTFVANHDTDEISSGNKLMAYAYILTLEGTPVIFYKDYESLLDKAKMDNLIWINKNLAAGSTSKLYISKEEFILQRNGSPGLVVYFNIGRANKRKVQTKWQNTVLKDYTGQNPDVTTDANGYATIAVQRNSYAIYSPK